MGSLASAEAVSAAEEASEEPPAAADAAETSAPESGCQICAEAPRSVRLVPCGHCSTCAKCTIRLITRASARKCPLCRVQFERVAWQSTAPVPLRREPTFEAAADGTGITLREFLLAAAIEPYVVRAPAAVPPALLAEVGAALELENLREGEILRNTVNHLCAAVIDHVEALVIRRRGDALHLPGGFPVTTEVIARVGV